MMHDVVEEPQLEMQLGCTPATMQDLKLFCSFNLAALRNKNQLYNKYNACMLLLFNIIIIIIMVDGVITIIILLVIKIQLPPV